MDRPLHHLTRARTVLWSRSPNTSSRQACRRPRSRTRLRQNLEAGAQTQTTSERAAADAADADGGDAPDGEILFDGGSTDSADTEARAEARAEAGADAGGEAGGEADAGADADADAGADASGEGVVGEEGVEGNDAKVAEVDGTVAALGGFPPFFFVMGWCVDVLEAQ